jgi:hypothetical protein
MTGGRVEYLIKKWVNNEAEIFFDADEKMSEFMIGFKELLDLLCNPPFTAYVFKLIAKFKASKEVQQLPNPLIVNLMPNNTSSSLLLNYHVDDIARQFALSEHSLSVICFPSPVSYFQLTNKRTNEPTKQI